MKNIRQAPEYLALTGRVKNWLENEESRLPVSCTVFNVEDSMEGDNGIEASWIFTSHGIRNAAGVAINLSNLRPSGFDNGKGLVSSGAASFAKFYSLINQELRRGGTYKNGAVTLFLDHDHGDCEEYLRLTPTELPWAKKSLYVDDTLKDNPLLPLIAEKVNNGTLWLAKKQYDDQGNRLYSNVCQEILIPSRGTCLLSHINLGQVADIGDLVEMFTESARWLCELHGQTGIGEDDWHYLEAANDKQVGLGVIGLANMLAYHRITYSDFSYALDYVTGTEEEVIMVDKRAMDVAYKLQEAFAAAAKVGREFGMERLFTVAPTASSSYNYTDLQGFTTAPEISPPLDYEVDRDSGTFGVQTYEYHPQTEIACEVGWETYFRLANAWQRLMNSTGLAHTMSVNIWSQIRTTPEWITDVFLPSDLATTYYRISVDNQALDKSEIVNLDSDEAKLAELYQEPATAAACPIFPLPEDDPAYCSACAG